MATARWGIPLEEALLDRVWPAVIFTYLLYAKLDKVIKLLRTPASEGGTSGLPLAVAVAHELGLIAVAALVVILFVIRRPPIGQRSRWLGAVVAIAGTFAISLFVVQSPPPSTDWRVLAASTALLFLGAAITVVSLATLGRCFGIFPEARGLVTRGPYRHVRHPVYLGEFISAFGALLPIIAPWTVLVFVAFVVLQLWRTFNEERALEAAFPEYRAYRERTRRLIPGVL